MQETVADLPQHRTALSQQESRSCLSLGQRTTTRPDFLLPQRLTPRPERQSHASRGLCPRPVTQRSYRITHVSLRTAQQTRTIGPGLRDSSRGKTGVPYSAPASRRAIVSAITSRNARAGTLAGSTASAAWACSNAASYLPSTRNASASFIKRATSTSRIKR